VLRAPLDDVVNVILLLVGQAYARRKFGKPFKISRKFRFDEERNIYICPAGKMLATTGISAPITRATQPTHSR
jgi:hypothetical protein